ncbi:hypothetical protein OAM23_00520 [Luminiphilus sp.]|nr:hypothetical protein [Luminiphilus sp.]
MDHGVLAAAVEMTQVAEWAWVARDQPISKVAPHPYSSAPRNIFATIRR